MLTLPRPLQTWLARRRIGRKRTHRALFLTAAIVATLLATPLLYIFFRALTADGETWVRLAQTRLVGLLWNTLTLTVTVTLGTLLVGVTLAWLVERTDVPGRDIFRWLLAVPLAIPAFIGGVVQVALLRPRGGLVPQFFVQTLGVDLPLPNPFGFWGAVFVLTLFMYPYVYLLSAAAFRGLHASLEEAARSLGRGTWTTLWEVTLPALRPGLTAGALLVALDVLAEYGTVALLRYETFSAAIFLQLSGRYNREAAAILSGVLVTVAVLILLAELSLQGRRRFEQVSGAWRPAPVLRLGRWRWAAFGVALGVTLAAVVVPLVTLVGWTLQGVLDTSAVAAVYRFSTRDLPGYVWNSLWSAGLAAVSAVTLSVPVAYVSARYPRTLTKIISRLCQVGYALPGVVVALSLISLVNRGAPWLYGTPFIVVLAYLLRHMPQAVRSTEAALAQLSVSIEEAAQSLGRSQLQALIQVVVPLLFPSLLAGAALVFLTSLKELPATLLLRPAGFDTLAVRVWLAANDGVYTQAAPAALGLILCAAGPLAFLLKNKVSEV